MIAGITIGGFIVLLVLIALIFHFTKDKTMKKKEGRVGFLSILLDELKHISHSSPLPKKRYTPPDMMGNYERTTNNNNNNNNNITTKGEYWDATL